MSRKTLVWTVLVVGCLTSVAAASCNDSYTNGRAALFDGTLSGLREAYLDFNDAMGSSTCASNNNLVFLHALTRTAMLFIDDSNLALADSFIDIANGFGVTIVGDYFDELNLSVPMPGGCYTIPPGAPDANEIYLRIQNSVIPEINSILTELGTIKDTASKRFLISFTPTETGLDKTLKVDYSEVLILKGLLLALKSQLEFKQVYNLTVDPNDPAVQDVMSHVFCGTDAPLPNGTVNNLLGNDPNLLTVLPGGKAILAQSKQDMINAINYYFAVVKYLQAMKAPQDHLIYIDADAKPTVASIATRLTTLQNSLKKDTAGKYVWETIKTYKVRKGSKVIGNLVLVYDVTGLRSGDGGTLTFTSSVTPASWKVDDFGGTGADFGIDLESSSGQKWGWFEGTLSSDGKKITNGSFEYWDEYDDNTIDLSAQFSKTQTIYKRLDLNPVFSSKRYPTPVSPRNLLPQFDNSNLVIPGTVGHGLGNATLGATLGGIVPDMNQQDWEH